MFDPSLLFSWNIFGYLKQFLFISKKGTENLFLTLCLSKKTNNRLKH